MTAPDLPMTMKVYSATGTFLCEFPYFANLMVLDAVNDLGSFSFNWNANSPGASNLISDTALQMAVCMDFRDGNGYTEVARYLYEQDTYDPSMQESAVIQANGRSIVALLDQAIVYPKAGIGSTTTSWSFTGASPGKIMNDLVNAAKARGCFPSLTTSFTSGQDSSGHAWTQSFTNAYGAGQSLLQVLLGLAQGGLCDFNMSGTTLNMYNANTTLANDLSTSVYLRRGRDIISLPAQRDRTQIGTAMLAIGDNGVNVERTASTLGTIGRYEKYLAQGGVTDIGTLSYWADQSLGAIDDQQVSYTPSYVVNISSSTPIPWKNFKPGDYISIDLAGTPVKFRARQWAVQCTPGGPATIQPTLNDVFYDQNTLLQGRVQALSGSVTGVSTIVNLPGPNATVPNPPALDLPNTYTGAYYSPATGTTLAQVELAWLTPTNTDGSSVTDGAQVVIQYRLSTTPIYPIAWSQLQGKPWSTINGNPWSNPLATPQNQQWTTVSVPFDQNNAIIDGLICGETYQFQIAASDVSGNTSAFSGSSLIATARDNVAPSKPDAPTVAASMVSVQVVHDLGQASGGTYNLEHDLDHLEVHYSYDPSFTPVPGVSSTTYLGKLIANAGMMQSGIAAVGTFHVTSVTGIYIKVIAVDESGNTSPPSNGSGVTVVLIDDSHISSLTVSKLLAGTVMASIVLGGTIATALTGQRVQMDSTGVHAYDVNGTIYFDLNNTSTTLLLSQGDAGPKITMDTIGVFPTMRLFDTVGLNNAFINAVDTTGDEANPNTASIGINSGNYTDGTNVWRNRLYMRGEQLGIKLQVIDDANGQNNGGLVNLLPRSAIFGLFVEGSAHGGQVLFSYDSADGDASMEIDGYYALGAPQPQQNIFTMYFTGIGASIGVNVTYGATMLSQTLPVSQYSCGTTGTVGGNVNGFSTTGYSFSLNAASPASWSVWTLGMRTR